MQLPLDFINPTSKSPLERRKEKKSATSQTDLIYSFFSRRRGQRFTSVQVRNALSLNLNSTRRAMTVLYKEGRLRKLEATRVEEFGKPNHYYTIS